MGWTPVALAEINSKKEFLEDKTLYEMLSMFNWQRNYLYLNGGL